MTKSKKIQRNSTELADEERRGKRRYRMRVIQEQEAKEYVNDYFVEDQNPQRLSPMGKKRYDQC
jgi:hypothetical protein